MSKPEPPRHEIAAIPYIFPTWVNNGEGFECSDSKQLAYAEVCQFLGFNLPEFDIWATSLPDCQNCGTGKDCCLKQEMHYRRKLALEALSENNEDALLRHLEWMLNRQRGDMREQYLLPLARRDKKRQDGTKKERRPEISQWIASKLKQDSMAKSPDLWKSAPRDITDVIGVGAFSKRVTEQRKKLDIKYLVRRK